MTQSRGPEPVPGYASDVERAILKARAEALARPLAPLVDRSDDVEYALFAVDGERYAVEARCVREVVPLPEITPLPGRARVLVGITALRGEILAVASLGRLFAGPAAPLPSSAGYLMVLGRERAEIGVLATAVEEVTGLDLSALGAAGRASELTKGVTGDGLVVLDAEPLLSDPRLFVEDDDA